MAEEEQKKKTKKAVFIVASRYASVQPSDILLGSLASGYAIPGDEYSLLDCFRNNGYPFLVKEETVDVPWDTIMTLPDPKSGLSFLVKPSNN
jgi:hypothetical protein